MGRFLWVRIDIGGGYLGVVNRSSERPLRFRFGLDLLLLFYLVSESDEFFKIMCRGVVQLLEQYEYQVLLGIERVFEAHLH